MKCLFFLFLSFSSSSALATTTGRYLGLQLVVNIASHNSDGSVDGSPQALFEAMDRPEQDSVLGRGKALEAPQKVLNFICAKRAENQYQCSIYIHKSNLGRIAPGKAYFEARGDEAKAYFQQFYSQDDVFSFKDEANTLVIYATPERFIIKYDAQGV